MFQKPRGHLIIVGDCRVTWNKFQIEDPQTLRAIAQNLDARATWCPDLCTPDTECLRLDK